MRQSGQSEISNGRGKDRPVWGGRGRKAGIGEHWWRVREVGVGKHLGRQRGRWELVSNKEFRVHIVPMNTGVPALVYSIRLHTSHATPLELNTAHICGMDYLKVGWDTVSSSDLTVSQC